MGRQPVAANRLPSQRSTTAEQRAHASEVTELKNMIEALRLELEKTKSNYASEKRRADAHETELKMIHNGLSKMVENLL